MKKFKIYQLPVEHNAKFMRLSFVKEHNIMPKLEDYKLVYEGELDDDNQVSEIYDLDTIYGRFQGTKPEGYKGTSISVSDVVFIYGKYFYCDSYGWEEVTFLTEKPEPKKLRTVTIYAGLLHFAKNGDLLHGATKVGTWFVDNIWEKQGGRRDRSGNLTVEKMYYAKLDGYDRSYFGYTRKDLKQMLEGKQAKITLNTITFRPEDIPQEVA